MYLIPVTFSMGHHGWTDKKCLFPVYISLISCYFPGTDIMLWHGKSGKNLGTVDTNQLKNNMAAVSPNGRFIAAAAFTADVKVGTLNYLLHIIMFNHQRGNL